MNPSTVIGLLELLPELAAHLPNLGHDALKTYADVAHGEGGLVKVRAFLGDVVQFVDDAIGALPTPTAAPTTPAEPAAAQ